MIDMKDSSKLNVNGRLFYDTATIINITRDKIEYKCDICGLSKEVFKDSYDNGNVTMCVNCKYGKTAGKAKRIMLANKRKIEEQKKLKAEQKKQEEFNRLNKGKLTIIDETDELDYMVRCNDCGELYLYRKRQFDNAKYPICLKCSTRGRYVNMEGKTFGNLTITRELGGGNAECLCESCGAKDDYIKTQVVNGLVKCTACKNKDIDIQNLKGNVVNTLYIIKNQVNEDNQIKAYCLVCGSVKSVNIGEVLNSTAKCTCEEVKKYSTCRFCGKNTYKIDIKNKVIQCENKNCSSNYYRKIKGFEDELKINMSAGLYIVTCRELYNKSLDRNSFSIVNDTQGNKCLVAYEKPIYVGRDNRKYFRIYCLQHKRYLVLSEAEIGDITKTHEIRYNHELCDSKYDMSIEL